MKDMITMSNQELHRVEIVQKLIDKRLTESGAAAQCHLSVRQIRRLKKLYLAHGAEGLISKKRGKPSNHWYPDSVKTLILAYVHEYYRDFRPTFACEKLSENHDLHVSHETLRQWMIEAELWQSKAQRLKRSFQPRNRRECFGELIQAEATAAVYLIGAGAKKRIARQFQHNSV